MAKTDYCNLNCGEVTPTKFKVLAPDPHRFDGDRDSAEWLAVRDHQ